MNHLNNTHFDRYVEIFNSQGKAAAIEYITQEYNLDSQAFQRKLRLKSNYVYDRQAKKYRVRDSETPFMSLEELCSTKSTPIKKEIAISSTRNIAIFETVVIDLMKDRLTEIAKYILFEQSLKEIHIDSERLQRDGYTLTMGHF